jgi:hypothetical protein
MTRRLFISLVTTGSLLLPAQTKIETTEPVTPPPQFVCPMDPDVKSDKPGKCPRCGMEMVARILEPQAFILDLTVHPSSAPAGRPLEFAFRILDPANSHPAKDFEVIHEKLCHLFLVSGDLNWFLHDHPVLGADGIFRLPVTLPARGMYEAFVDLYPHNATPQWLTQFIYTENADPGTPAVPDLKPDLSTQKDGDVTVSVELEPARPFVGQKTTLYCTPHPADGLEKWLGTYAHAFWVSQDLVDSEHTHPVTPEIGQNGELTFQAYFPRAGTYRFWIQFQRRGTLHTVHFDIPVTG